VEAWASSPFAGQLETLGTSGPSSEDSLYDPQSAPRTKKGGDPSTAALTNS